MRPFGLDPPRVQLHRPTIYAKRHLVPFGPAACRGESSFAPTGACFKRVRCILHCHGPSVMGVMGKRTAHERESAFWLVGAAQAATRVPGVPIETRSFKENRALRRSHKWPLARSALPSMGDGELRHDRSAVFFLKPKRNAFSPGAFPPCDDQAGINPAPTGSPPRGADGIGAGKAARPFPARPSGADSFLLTRPGACASQWAYGAPRC